jgi:UDP-N-acetyl-D-mannosaminuronate dehydrogenase
VAVAHKLRSRGAVIAFHDPHVASWNLDGEDLKRVPDLHTALHDCDVAVLLQAHAAYDLPAVAATAPLLLDTRGRLPQTDHVEVL